MNRYEQFISMPIEELASWIDKYVQHDDSPWVNWFDNKYCKNCKAVIVPLKGTSEVLGIKVWYGDRFEANYVEASYCEVNHECRYFPDMEESPSIKEIIQMWLKEEVE